ncbi:hypothetical protein NHX12_008863 [Muraenolepis orangiensis]|uniref:Apolipoprotein A-I n=1 Tax=Muraenolepis orangiensis TaxID=630683 RepID=A0A9Q0DPN9_9TELE|nr:hypothetical protein NHX12_008863 [Muraenolepis orangiensis]
METATMLYVTLALALLATVSNAASLEADAPTQLAHIRSAVFLYLDQVKDSATRALGHLDGTEYEAYKVQLSTSMDNLQASLKVAQANAAPYTDAVVGQVMEATSEVRTSIMADVAALRTELEPKREALKKVVDAHIQQYRTILEPIITEYSAKHRADMEVLKTKLEPIMAELTAKVSTNVEETKAALVPIVESVRTKLTERLENLQSMAKPYVEEYKEQLDKAFADVKLAAGSLKMEDIRKQVEPHVESIKAKAMPLVEEAKLKLTLLYETISEVFNKQ